MHRLLQCARGLYILTRFLTTMDPPNPREALGVRHGHLTRRDRKDDYIYGRCLTGMIAPDASGILCLTSLGKPRHGYYMVCCSDYSHAR